MPLYDMRFLLPMLAVALLTFSELSAGERVLQTPKFRIVIAHLCEEGCVSCDTIFYHGTNKKTKTTIALVGETLHTMASDGVTPSRFIGYRFVNEGTTYLVQEGGLLTVTQNDNVILEEEGVWE